MTATADRISFFLFCAFLAAQTAATFSPALREAAPLIGFRLYETPARDNCRAEFEGDSGTGYEFFVPDLPVRSRILNRDEALPVLWRSCREEPTMRRARVKLTCPGDQGWLPPTIQELPCRPGP